MSQPSLPCSTSPKGRAAHPLGKPRRLTRAPNSHPAPPQWVASKWAFPFAPLPAIAPYWLTRYMGSLAEDNRRQRRCVCVGCGVGNGHPLHALPTSHRREDFSSNAEKCRKEEEGLKGFDVAPFSLGSAMSLKHRMTFTMKISAATLQREAPSFPLGLSISDQCEKESRSL